MTHPALKKMGSILGLFLAFSTNCQSGVPTPDWEQTQKVKIMRYLIEKVSWPANSIKNDLNICVLNNLDSVKQMKTLTGERIKNYQIQVKQVQYEKVARENCQVLYIPGTENKHEHEIIRTFYRHPVLLISDLDGFAEKGGSMNFVLIKKVVAITVNVESLKKSNLKIELADFGSITVVPNLNEVFD